MIVQEKHEEELYERILARERIPELEAAFIAKCIFQALAHCHSKRIVFRDLKCEKILFDSKKSDSIPQLYGFDYAKELRRDEYFDEVCGTVYYIAPEIIDSSKSSEAGSEKCDIWSMGVILYIMLAGYPPFDGDSDEEILSLIMKCEY